MLLSSASVKWGLQRCSYFASKESAAGEWCVRAAKHSSGKRGTGLELAVQEVKLSLRAETQMVLKSSLVLAFIRQLNFSSSQHSVL